MRYTINLDCKTQAKKDGTFPILLRVSINGSHSYINTGKHIKENHYDKANKCVKSGVNGAAALISFIERQKARIDNIIVESEKKGEVLSHQRLRELYYKESGKVPTFSFYSFVEDAIKRERALAEISEGQLKNCEKELRKLKKYKASLSIHDITVSFLQDYKAYILTTLHHSNNTAYHAMCFIRKYTKMLYKSGKIAKYPFDEFIVGKPFEVDPEFLEPDELNALHELYQSQKLVSIMKPAKSKYARDFNIGERYQAVLRYFLASCYCGLRHSDIKTLQTSEIKGKYIVKTMKKGRKRRTKTVRIPIRNRLFSVIEKNSKSGLAFENAVMENSQTNKYLKKIMQIAGIKKHITFHAARHTFAINSLIFGIGIEVISDVLGHSELTTTQRYARIINIKREQEMSKWDKIESVSAESDLQQINCPVCDYELMRLPTNIVKLKRMPCECTICGTAFQYDFAKRASISMEPRVVA